jgi:hypothetical protein
MFKRSISLSTLSFLFTALFAGIISAQSPAGTWELYPEQSSSYTTSVQQPINVDGSSNFKANGKAVIPIKFSLSTAPGPIVFESIYSENPSVTANDFSFASFTPASTLLFKDIANLSAVYEFTQGNCHGGSLRWSVRVSSTQSVFIYYGDYPNFTDCKTGVNYQTGINLITMSDLRFDTTQVGGEFYDDYTGAKALVGEMPIVRASLVLDSGWGGDQKLTLTNATVNGNTFTGASSGSTPTCDLPPATIQITKTAGATAGAVNEPISIQPADNDSMFRVVDCKYMYNLATSSLSGPGTYKVTAVINGTPAGGSASFDLK